MAKPTKAGLEKKVADLEAKMQDMKINHERRVTKIQAAGFGLLPKALHLLDDLCIAGEQNDRNHIIQAAGTAREFLDKLPADVQASFRDWHPNK